MSTSVLGNGTFLDAETPLKGKSEWGIDTLVRRVTGARSLAESFIATLAQGQIYQGYYLQTWDADENPNVATITLNYKGLFTGGTPLPRATTQIVSAVGQSERDFSTEGNVNGVPQGRFYRRDLIWTVTTNINGDTESVSGFRDRYALSARMEFTYRAVQTTYRYVTIGRRFGPSYVFPDTPYPAILDRARIILNDGTILPRTQWEVFFNLTPIAIYKNVSFQADPVIGTPFFECTDVAQQTLGSL